MKTCRVCGRPYNPEAEGAVIDGVPHCSGCQRDAEEVEEDAKLDPYTEEALTE